MWLSTLTSQTRSPFTSTPILSPLQRSSILATSRKPITATLESHQTDPVPRTQPARLSSLGPWFCRCKPPEHGLCLRPSGWLQLVVFERVLGEFRLLRPE